MMTDAPKERDLNELLLAADQAREFIARIDDPTVRNLVQIAVAQLTRRVLPQSHESVEEWRTRLPCAPFDMLFYVTVLAQMFSQKDLLRDVLDGKSTAEASGWDF